jgi:molybdopterin-binding protein
VIPFAKPCAQFVENPRRRLRYPLPNGPPTKSNLQSLGAISRRNKLFGKVAEVRYDGLLAQVSIDVGGQIITSIITSDAARDLGLKKGVSVYALVKATEVMVIRE